MGDWRRHRGLSVRSGLVSNRPMWRSSLYNTTTERPRDREARASYPWYPWPGAWPIFMGWSKRLVEWISVAASLVGDPIGAWRFQPGCLIGRLMWPGRPLQMRDSSAALGSDDANRGDVIPRQLTTYQFDLFSNPHDIETLRTPQSMPAETGRTATNDDLVTSPCSCSCHLLYYTNSRLIHITPGMHRETKFAPAPEIWCGRSTTPNIAGFDHHTALRPLCC